MLHPLRPLEDTGEVQDLLPHAIEGLGGLKVWLTYDNTPTASQQKFFQDVYHAVSQVGHGHIDKPVRDGTVGPAVMSIGTLVR
jgi:hypothetical protein